MILAQGQPAGTGVQKVFDYIAELDFPSPEQFVADLQELGTLQAVALVLGGVALMIWGFKYFKLFVIANAAALGGLCGMYLGERIGSTNMPLVMGLAGAVLFGVLAYPSIKYFVGLMGALAGALIGFALWCFVANALHRDALRQHAWAGGVIGMIAIGMLAWLAFRAAVMIFTSVQGAIMAVSGLCSLALAHEGIAGSLRPHMEGNPSLISLLIGVPAALGFACQFSTETAKVRKKRKATEKPPV